MLTYTANSSQVGVTDLLCDMLFYGTRTAQDGTNITLLFMLKLSQSLRLRHASILRSHAPNDICFKSCTFQKVNSHTQEHTLTKLNGDISQLYSLLICSRIISAVFMAFSRSSPGLASRSARSRSSKFSTCFYKEIAMSEFYPFSTNAGIFTQPSPSSASDGARRDRRVPKSGL